MKVKLTYFKPSGKYYSCGEYETTLPREDLAHGSVKAPPLFLILDEVTSMMVNGRLPDLMPGHSNFSVLVDVPDHPHRHPRMIFGAEVSLTPNDSDAEAEHMRLRAERSEAFMQEYKRATDGG